jgi:2',3'-cyclic-nucleotide 2'-phosphodiesterase/3'-nucleotidase
LDGTPVEDNKLYKVITNDFVFEGGDQYSMIQPVAKNVLYTYEPIRDVLIAEAEKAGAIDAHEVKVLTPVSD